MKEQSYQLIALDIDGTLLNTNKEITPDTEAAVHRAFAAGKEVVLSTGRSFAELAEILHRMMSPDARQELTSESAFRDVGCGHWAYEAVSAMAGLRLMLGDGNGNFRPDDGVTGEELSVILERVRAQESGKEALAALSSGWAAQDSRFPAASSTPTCPAVKPLANR